MAMDAILANIAEGKQAIVDIDREAGRNKLIYHFMLSHNTKPFHGSLGQPLL